MTIMQNVSHLAALNTTPLAKPANFILRNDSEIGGLGGTEGMGGMKLDLFELNYLF